MRNYFKLCGSCKFMHECEKQNYLIKSEKLLNIKVELEECIDYKKRITGKYVLDNLNGSRNLAEYSNIIDFTNNVLEMSKEKEIHCYMSKWAVFNLFRDFKKISSFISLKSEEKKLENGIEFRLPDGTILKIWHKDKLPKETSGINKEKIIEVYK
jgi:hypothetical protein